MADDFLLFLTDTLVESAGLDRMPAQHPLRELFVSFDEVVAGDRGLVLLARADDRGVEDCRRLLDRFEEMRLARQFPVGLDSLLVVFVHARRASPERLAQIAALRPAVDHNLFVLEVRAVDVEAGSVLTRAGWLSRARPALGLMEDALRHWSAGGAVAPTSAEVDRKVLARFEGEDRFVKLLFAASAPASIVLLGLLGALFAVMSFAGRQPEGASLFAGFGSDVLVRFGAKVNDLVRAGEWWRLISCTFIHGDLLHLLFNGYGLWALGPLLERYFGTRRFLLLWFTGGLAGSLASLWFNPATVPSVGASGALFGLVGAIVILGLVHRRVVPGRIRTRLLSGMVSILVLNLILGSLLPNIDQWGHLGGAVGGAAAALILSPRDELSGAVTPSWRKTVFAALLVPVAVSLAFAVNGFVRLGGDPLRHPPRTFIDGSGTLRIDYPAILRPEPLAKGTRLVGPGFEIVFWTERLIADPSADLRKEIEEEVPRAFRHRLMVTGTGEKRTIGEHVWLSLELAPLAGGGRHPALAGVVAGRIVLIAFVGEGTAVENYGSLLEKTAASVRRADR